MANQNEPTGWVGWIAFAGAMMILAGIFQFIAGLTALFNPNWYVHSQQGLLLLNFTTWGWIHLLLGIALGFIGSSLFSGSTAGRVFAVILVGLSAIANMAFVGAYPWWSLLIITVDILVIYALVVHGSELKEGRA